jgi:DNA-binding HxlR family transcriptional regulator
MNTEKIVCPVDRTLNLFNKKWSIQIIRDMFFGKKHFKEFKEDKPNLSNKVLSSCLKELEENGLIEKKSFKYKSCQH